MLCFNHLSSLSWEIPFVQLFFMVGSLPVGIPSGCLLSAASVDGNIYAQLCVSFYFVSKAESSQDKCIFHGNALHYAVLFS